MLRTNKRTNKRINKRTNKRTYSRKKTKNNGYINIQKGSGIIDSIGKSIYQPIETKDYKTYFPGEKLVKSFTNNINNNSSPKNIMTVIFKYKQVSIDPINIDNIGSTILNTTDIEKEPHIYIKYNKKCLVIMYENIINKKKIYWIAEYNNGTKTKSILHYKSPKLNNGLVHSLILELYIYPQNDISQLSLIPSLKLSPKASYNWKVRYLEFLKYTITNKIKLIPQARKVFYAQYKVDNIGTNIFSILSSKSLLQSKEMFKYGNTNA